jgi:competence protein ComEA
MQWIKTLFCSTAMLFAASTFSAEPVETARISLNTANAEQLAQLEGIGKAKAEAIVRYRTEHGEFSSIEELTNVRGIGQSILEKNRALIAVE